ncbi:dephospho-CoA kinase [Mucilaginibacter daejeonensis]|uniref:dephospho-CoA kinase n=1 Tax=Mucilaginibacter daejeonensis TaxID=398049 RepID=UPI001D17C0C2|nr:dephospho-CoA kinase [Mucilaginibacter daejeonensis]UEG54645.1 dephospho-CoA kinase [Mucilaginibacter daejeonensis]
MSQLKIGITGNIGSGKTTVSHLFELLDIQVFNSDDQAKAVMTTDQELISGIKAAFGEQAYLPGGALDRKYIANIVFNDQAALTRLNGLVHPAVFRAFDAWVGSNHAAPYVMKEAAILFESGSYKDCDHTILVTAPTDVRLQRVAKRDGISLDEAAARNARQMPEKEKRQLATFEVVNDNTQLVIPQVLKMHQHFLELAAAKA